jgi:hypothetical protein
MQRKVEDNTKNSASPLRGESSSYVPPVMTASVNSAMAGGQSLRDSIPNPEISTAESVPHKHTTGEAIFDGAVYGGLGWGANTALSIVFGYLFKYGAGRKHFESMADKMAPRWSAMTGSSPKQARRSAESNLIVTALFAAGSSLLLPIKALEDRKPELVAALDNWWNGVRAGRGDAPTQAELQGQALAHDAIAQQPRQTWRSIVEARGAALAAAIGTGMYVLRGADAKAAETLGKKTGDMLKNSRSPSLQRLGKSTKFRATAEMAFLDVAYAAYGAAVLYAYSHFIHPPRKQEESQETAPSPATVPMLVEGDDTGISNWTARYAAARTKNCTPCLASAGQRFQPMRMHADQAGRDHETYMAMGA